MIKNRLKEIRMKEYMMIPRDFAELIGLSYSYYSEVESNKKIVSLKKAFDIAEKLNKRLEDIWYKD